jgi:endonuclease I
VISQYPRILTVLLISLLTAGMLQARTANEAAKPLPAPYFAAPRSDPAHEPPAGYYQLAEGLVGDQLKAALHQIIRGHTPYPYSSGSLDTWDILKDADRDPNNPNNVWLVYNGVSVNGAQEYNGGAGWNREHVWPQSLGGFNTGTVAGTDAHNLRACNEQVNSRRGSLEFDYGGSPLTIQGLIDTYADNDSLEPNNSFKGDMARIIFYMAVRYEGGTGEPNLEVDDFTNRGTGTFGKMSSLLAWHLLDPVDDFERRRNARIYAYQGNRNPFIDRPDWVRAVFDPNYAPPDFAVEPDTAVAVSGLVGGPFDPLQQVYTVIAGQDRPLAWKVSVNVPWLSVSPTEGELGPGGRTDLTVFVNSAAVPTTPGSYIGTVRFQNPATGAAIVRQVVANILTPARLAVTPSDSQTVRGPVGGPFVPASWQYIVSNAGVTPMSWSATGPAWLGLSPAGGSLDPGQVVTVTAEPNAAAAALAAGGYDGVVAFANLTNGDGNTARAVRLEAGTRDYFTQQFTTTVPFNLSNKSVMFTPNESGDFYRANVRVVSSFPVNPAGGTSLQLGDDTSLAVTAPAGNSFKLYGVSYPSVYVGSNGYLTFASADSTHSESLTSHFVRARISALFDDLNPGAGGSVSWRQLPDRLAVTWQGVPHFGSGGSNSFQVELFLDGRIRMTWLGITSAAGIVGLSRGSGVPADFSASDFVSYPADAVAIDFFSPGSGPPGTVVTIEGSGLDAVTEVLFGGAPAAFAIVDAMRLVVTVPTGAITGAITVLAGGVEDESATDFYVTVNPAMPALSVQPPVLEGFKTTVGRPSSTQTFSISATALSGSLMVSAPPGFEVSADGVTFSATVEVGAPVRVDVAANYGGLWESGSNGGNGFGPWALFAGGGTAAAILGDPADSGVTGMAGTAFGLMAAGPADSDAFVSADRPLARPLAVGEAMSFDWGINWDSDNGLKGFEVLSGSAALFKVMQNGFPGLISLHEWFGAGDVPTGLGYGTHPMRWTFRQIDAQTVRVTATSREGGGEVVFNRDVPVPGAVSGFHWFASGMEPDMRRYSFFDRLAIEPITAGGGDLPPTAIHVRLAAGSEAAEVGGDITLTSGGSNSASVAVAGFVAPASAYDHWAHSHDLDPAGDGARAADPDGDGFSNGQEFAFGSDPKNCTASLINSEASKGELVVTWLERSGVNYRVQSAPSLAMSSFAEDDTVTIVDSAASPTPPVGYTRKQFTVAATGSKFYRVSATTP